MHLVIGMIMHHVAGRICSWRLIAAFIVAFSGFASASGRLIATGGVSELEGSAGGGIVPWAVIAGYGTRDQVSATAFHTNLAIDNFTLKSNGVAVGIHDRLELSFSRQLFGLGTTVPGQSIRQNVAGVKLKLMGDLVVDQDIWLPQVSAGMQYKNNLDTTVPRLIGARHDSGVDFYLSATKLYLAGLYGRNVLANLTLRRTKANQLGILGFGGDKRDQYRHLWEGSLAVMLKDDVVVGVEFRNKPDNLSAFREDDFYDLFLAYFPTKSVSATVAYARLGQIADKRNQKGTYLSLQFAY